MLPLVGQGDVAHCRIDFEFHMNSQAMDESAPLTRLLGTAGRFHKERSRQCNRNGLDIDILLQQGVLILRNEGRGCTTVNEHWMG